MAELKEIMGALEQTSDIYAAGLPPDGDWEPMLMIHRGDECALVGFEMVENGPKREYLFSTLLPNLIHEKFPNPDSVVMLVSSWYLSRKEEDFDPEELPSESQERKECLLLQGISKDEELMSMADIKRGESHPELDWIFRCESEQEFEGRLVGFLRRAVWN